MGDYRVLSGSSAKSLEEQVTDLMREGYKPLGGVSVTYAIGSSSLAGAAIASAPLFSQAMFNDQLEPPVNVEDDDLKKAKWVATRIEDYKKYWDDKKQRYIIDKDGSGPADELWQPTHHELVADLENAYEFEKGEK